VVPSKVRIYGYDFKESTYTKKIKEPKKSKLVQTKTEAHILKKLNIPKLELTTYSQRKTS
jgi:hypothetical protein